MWPNMSVAAFRFDYEYNFNYACDFFLSGVHKIFVGQISCRPLVYRIPSRIAEDFVINVTNSEPMKSYSLSNLKVYWRVLGPGA